MSERSSHQKASKEQNIPHSIPEAKPLKERLRVCKIELDKIAFDLRPEGSLDTIEEKQVRDFLEKLNKIIVEVNNAPDQSEFFKPKEGVYEYIVAAKRQLIVSLRMLKAFEDLHTRQTYDDYVVCLLECHKYLSLASKLFSV